MTQRLIKKTKFSRYTLLSVATLLSLGSCAFLSHAHAESTIGGNSNAQLLSNDDPYRTTVATEGFPSIEKERYYKRTVKNQYFLAGNYILLGKSISVSINPINRELTTPITTVFQGQPGQLSAGYRGDIQGDVWLYEDKNINSKTPADAPHAEFGYITFKRLRNNPVQFTVHGDWIGGNDAPPFISSSGESTPRSSANHAAQPANAPHPATGGGDTVRPTTGGDAVHPATGGENAVNPSAGSSYTSHKLFLTSHWNSIENSSETNTGLVSDLLHIKKDVYGYTEVVPNAVNGVQGPGTSTMSDPGVTTYALAEGTVGGAKVSAAPLITVDGKIQYKHSFYGTLNLENGSQAQLLPYDNGKEGAENVHGFTWGFITEKPILQADGTFTIPKQGTSLREDVPTALGIQQHLNNATTDIIGTLHERESQRLGTAAIAPKNEHRSGLWVRLLAQDNTRTNYDQFTYADKYRGIQVGVPFANALRWSADGRFKGSKTSSVALSYLDTSQETGDTKHIQFDESTGKYLQTPTQTGRMDSKNFALSVHQTNRGLRSYQDWTAQALYGQATLTTPALADSTPTAYKTLALSYEAGRTLHQGKNWALDGESQLTFIHQHINPYTVQNLSIVPSISNQLTARLGLRYHRNNLAQANANTPYITLDVYQRLTPTPRLQVGTGLYNTSASRTTIALGLGGQHYLNDKNSYIYGSLKYMHDLDNDGFAQGWKWNLGWRTNY